MRNIVNSGLLWFGFLACAPAHANGVPPMRLEAQLRAADLVAVGQLGAHTTCLVARSRLPCAEIATDVILKGAPGATGTRRYLILNSGVAELSVERVQIPGSALFFLTRVLAANPDARDDDTEFYRPVRGRRSILSIENNNDESMTRAR